MRTRTVEMDDFKLAVAPLSLEQVEAYLAPLPEGRQPSDPAALPDVKTRDHEMIVNALNNAAKQPGEWTVARLRKEFDIVLLGKVRETVLQMSGLEVVKVEKDGAPGEAKPAPLVQ